MQFSRNILINFFVFTIIVPKIIEFTEISLTIQAKDTGSNSQNWQPCNMGHICTSSQNACNPSNDRPRELWHISWTWMKTWLLV